MNENELKLFKETELQMFRELCQDYSYDELVMMYAVMREELLRKQGETEKNLTEKPYESDITSAY